jgi:hypothetical protein
MKKSYIIGIIILMGMFNLGWATEYTLSKYSYTYYWHPTNTTTDSTKVTDSRNYILGTTRTGKVATSVTSQFPWKPDTAWLKVSTINEDLRAIKTLSLLINDGELLDSVKLRFRYCRTGSATITTKLTNMKTYNYGLYVDSTVWGNIDDAVYPEIASVNISSSSQLYYSKTYKGNDSLYVYLKSVLENNSISTELCLGVYYTGTLDTGNVATLDDYEIELYTHYSHAILTNKRVNYPTSNLGGALGLHATDSWCNYTNVASGDSVQIHTAKKYHTDTYNITLSHSGQTVTHYSWSMNDVTSSDY